MLNPLTNVIEKMPLSQKARYALARLRQEVIGLAQDFWKDGNGAPPDHLDSERYSSRVHPLINTSMEEGGLWHALPGEISEKMWGPLCVTPGDIDITEKLIMPLGLSKDMSVLDLSAGLGGRLRKTHSVFGVYIDGMEPDPDIAARGMEMSRLSGHGKHVAIRQYDPNNLTSTRTYDCAIARETIYRVPDKERFIKSIAACCKTKSQISFTDYVVDPEMHGRPAILAWQAYESGSNPPSLVEMAEMWAKQGFTLRVHDDQTDYYKKEIIAGMGRLAGFLASDVKPAPLTKKAINKRITTWAHRMAALQAGMKFYRFYGLR